MKNAISELVQLGFSNYEARAYTALLKNNPLTAYEIAKFSGIPSSKVYEVIRKLENRHTVQSIHGERARLFIPVSPDEFVQNYKLAVENNLHLVQKALKGYRVKIDTNYTWHIKTHNDLILRAKRMLRSARETVLLITWAQEISALREALEDTRDRGIKIAIVHYGNTSVRLGQIYQHPIQDTLYEARNIRGFTLTTDSKEALIGKIAGPGVESIWSMNEGFVTIVEDYIRHDIYLIKAMKRFDPILKEKFGERYEKLTDVFRDDDV